MKKGIVLVTTILVMSLILIGVSLALFLTSKSVKITGAEQRSYVAFEAAEGGVERGRQLIHYAFLQGKRDVDPQNFNISGYNVTVNTQFLATAPQPGGALEFGVGYLGIGLAASRGGATDVYSISSIASRPFGEYAGIDVVIKKVIGILGR